MNSAAVLQVPHWSTLSARRSSPFSLSTWAKASAPPALAIRLRNVANSSSSVIVSTKPSSSALALGVRRQFNDDRFVARARPQGPYLGYSVTSQAVARRQAVESAARPSDV